MTAINQEAIGIMFKLMTAHSDLRNSIKYEDREEALKATKVSALLGMRFLGLIPNLDKFGIKHVSDEEMSELRKKLNSLLS